MCTPDPRRRPRLRRTLLTAGLGALGLVALACGGGDDAAEQAGPDGTRAPTTTSAPDVLPLTGEPVTDEALAGRAALVVKIDNVDRASRPQAGINEADLVYEEKIEGPISRFAAVFHSTDAPDVGPVRSGRSTDVAIVSSLNRPLYAFSGANAEFLRQLRAAPLVDVGYDVKTDSYERRRDRTAPDNLFTSTARLWAHQPEGAGPPPPQLRYRGEGDGLPGSARPVLGVDYSFGARGAAVTYRWDADRAGWTRTQNGTPHVDTAGVQVAPANVIVQLVEYVDTGLVDTSGSPVPEARLVGEGEAWLLLDGHVVVGRWSKPDPATPTRFTDDAGSAVAFVPGRTWIALVPVGGDARLVETAG